MGTAPDRGPIVAEGSFAAVQAVRLPLGNRVTTSSFDLATAAALAG